MSEDKKWYELKITMKLPAGATYNPAYDEFSFRDEFDGESPQDAARQAMNKLTECPCRLLKVEVTGEES